MDSHWFGYLGKHNQWKGVPYVDVNGDGSLECLLCKTGRLYKGNISSHFNGLRHLESYNKATQMKKDVVSTQKRIECLGCIKWRDNVKGLVYDICCRGYNKPSIEYACTSYDVKKLISKYERMEIISLLEIAIWKAFICDGAIFQTVHEMKEYKKLDKDFEPTDYSNQVRIRKSGCAVIIPRVIEFLGPYTVG